MENGINHRANILASLITFGLWLPIPFKYLKFINDKNHPDNLKLNVVEKKASTINPSKNRRKGERSTDHDFFFCECSEPQITSFTKRECANCNRFVEQEFAKKLLEIHDEKILLNEECSALVPQDVKIFLVTECFCQSMDKKSDIYECVVALSEKCLYLFKRRIKLKLPNTPVPWTIEMIPYSKVTGIDQTFKMYLAQRSFHLVITRANNNDELFNLSKQSAQKLALEIQKRITDSFENRGSSLGNSLSSIESVEKIAQMYEKGLLSREEFETAKKRLLS